MAFGVNIPYAHHFQMHAIFTPDSLLLLAKGSCGWYSESLYWLERTDSATTQTQSVVINVKRWDISHCSQLLPAFWVVRSLVRSKPTTTTIVILQKWNGRRTSRRDVTVSRVIQTSVRSRLDVWPALWKTHVIAATCVARLSLNCATTRR